MTAMADDVIHTGDGYFRAERSDACVWLMDQRACDDGKPSEAPAIHMTPEQAEEVGLALLRVARRPL